jgi:hypothetical protein
LNQTKWGNYTHQFQAESFLSDLYRFKIYVRLVGGQDIFAISTFRQVRHPEIPGMAACGKMSMDEEGRVQVQARYYYALETVGSFR